MMNAIELCRLCALEKDNLLYIYSDEGHKLCIEAKIKKCLNIQLREKTNLPKTICLECCTKLDAFEEFLDLSHNAQTTLCLLFPEKETRTVGGVLTHMFVSKEDEFVEDFVPDEDVYSSAIEEDSLLLDGKHEYLSSYHDVNKEDHLTSTANVTQIDNDVGKERTDTSDTSEPDTDPKTSKNFEINLWLCSDCSEEFNSVEDLRQHHSSVHKQHPRYLCAYCAKVFFVHSGFVAHVKRHMSGLKFNCESCAKEFSTKKALDTHKLVHSNVRPFVCSECGKAFRQQSALFIHSRCHLPDDEKNKYPCNQCNKRFSTKPNLVTHMRIHTGIRNFTCDQCGKSFIQKGNLDAHLLTHSHDKPFKCELCNKNFKTSMQLRKHHSVHTGSKPHKCDICGRTFREKGTLREHHRIHTGAMPFTCEYCGKAFRFKGILTTHRRQHTGERPYSCNECQHHFTNWPNYNKHMKRRHGINLSRATRTKRTQEEKVVATMEQRTTPDPVPDQPQPESLLQGFQHTELYTNISTQNLPHSLPAGFVAYHVFSVDQVPVVESGEPMIEMPR